MGDLASRVNALIERYFDGNVYQASRAWGVPQPTAHRLATGATRSPRAENLSRIAAYHRTSVEWLLTGEGSDPLTGEPMQLPQYHNYRELVEGLGLSPEAQWTMLSLPVSGFAAYTVLCQWGIGFGSTLTEQPDDVQRAGRDAQRKATMYLSQAWYHFLDGLIRAYGASRVKEKLESEQWRARVGFHPVALELFNVEGGAELVRQAYVRSSYSRSPWAGVILVDSPALPPLDAIPPEQLSKPRRGRPRKSRPPRPR
jgi:hypothetical protein